MMGYNWWMAKHPVVPGEETSPPVEGGRPLIPERTLERSIGERTRELRLERGLTLAELAERVGIGKAMLSKIENAQTSCSLSTLSALAEGLDAPVSGLVREADIESQAIHVMAGEAPTIVRRGSNLGHQYQLLGALTGRQNILEPLLVTLTDETEPFPMFQHTGTEFIYVLEGSMSYKHGEETHVLNPGDSLLFDAEGVHGPSELYETPIRFLSVFTFNPGSRP